MVGETHSTLASLEQQQQQQQQQQHHHQSAAAAPSQQQDQMDQYEVLKPIAKGKYTVVYRARRQVDDAPGTASGGEDGRREGRWEGGSDKTG